jgi:tetraacyldisaccharide-1-P 4'-kinase
VWWREFPDHHAYRDADRAELARAADAATPDLFICTHKDLVKLPAEQFGGRPLWALSIEMQILAGAEALEVALDRVAQQARECPS